MDKPLHIIGVGGAGCAALDYFHQQGIEASYTCIAKNKKPDWPSSFKFIEFVSPKNRIRFPDMEVPLIIPHEVLNIFQQKGQFVLLAGLGGYTGTKMTEQLTIWLHEQLKDFITIASLSFSFETNRSYADATKNRLLHIPQFITIDLNEIRKQDIKMMANEAFAIANKQFFSMYKNHQASILN